MSGVFLSYSRADRVMAEQIARSLRAVGVKVWWDEDMQGVDWQQELERQISTLACVIVLWTPSSTESKNVRDEARLALSADKLVNVLAGQDQPPFPFDRVNGLRLDAWNGLDAHRGWTRVIETIEGMIVATGAVDVGDITGALARREHDLRLGQRALNDAQEAFQEAEVLAREEEQAAAAAAATWDQAENQFQRVAEMRGTTMILRAAQQELDSADEAKKAAERSLREARARLGAAAKALSKAKADLEAALAPKLTPLAPRSAKPAAARAPAGGKPRRTAAKAGDTLPKEAAPARTIVFEHLPPPAPYVMHAPEAVHPPADAPIQSGWFGLSVAALMFLAVGAVSVVIIAVVLLRGHGVRGAAPGQAAAAAGATDFSALPAVRGLAGDWAPPGLSCSDSATLKIDLDHNQLSLVSPEQTSTSTIVSADAAGVRTHASDGDFLYRAVGDTLSLTMPGGGAPMKLKRCAG